MDTVKDPVCGKAIDPSGAIRVLHNSKAYHFCSEDCSRAFQAEPGRYLEGDPAYTVSHGIAAPRFGSAGSGGLENEPPEAPGK